MKYKQINIVLWIASVIFTLAFVAYQRATGPTYPVSGRVKVNDKDYRYKLIRTFGGETDAPIKVKVEDTNITGSLVYKRYKSYDDWTTIPMQREGEYLIAGIPHQPPAGKVEYSVILDDGQSIYPLTDEVVIIRFKGAVPIWIVIIHVIFIFAAMLLSTRAGLEAFVNGRHVFLLTILTLISLVIGGFIFGPIMQKYAFGAYWTGLPFGHDLTDNKTLAALIFWAIALISLIRERQRYLWVKVASIVLVLVYLIPHSVLGSEIDHTKSPQLEIQDSTSTQIQDLDQSTLNSDTLND